MKSKQLRIFNIDGKEMVFDIIKFKKLFNYNAEKCGMGITRYEQEIADALFVDRSEDIHMDC